MSAKATEVEKGMDVYGDDGEQIGTVSEVWPNTAGYGHLPKSTTQLDSYGPVGGTGSILETKEGYIEVRQGSVLDAEGVKALYIPLNEIAKVTPERVTLDLTADAATKRYTSKPAELSQE